MMCGTTVGWNRRHFCAAVQPHSLDRLGGKMYCPECGCAFEDGIKVCSDCKVDLLKGEPPEAENKEEKKITWVEVCNPLDVSQVIFIKSLLQSESIPFSIEGENMNRLYGPFRVIPYRVFVPKEYAKTALRLLKDLK